MTDPIRESIIAEGWQQISEGATPCQPMPAPSFAQSVFEYASELFYWLNHSCKVMPGFRMFTYWEVYLRRPE